MMTPPSDDPHPAGERLVQYLLGSLPEDEAERLDELSVVDDEFVWRLRAAENDLVDAYVRGDLSGAALERFESSYLASAKRRAKVEFAEALRGIDGRRTVHAVQVRPSRFRQWALAAAALVAVIGAGYLFTENQRLRDEVTRAQSARAGLEQSAAELRTELEQERSAGASIRDELTRLRESLPGVRAPSLRPFVLLPMRRGAGELAAVAVPAGVERVPLRLRLESDDFPRFEAALRDPGTGALVWRSGRLSAVPDGADRSLDLEIEAALLKAQNYTLEVTGHPANGPAEFVTSYAFRVEAGR